MKTFDYDAVIYENEVYCLQCLPEGVAEDDYTPIFADSEWQSYPICDECGEVHNYVQMLPSFISRNLVKSKTNEQFRLNSNGDIFDSTEQKIAKLHRNDEGDLTLRIFEKEKKEKFKKTLFAEEQIVNPENIEDVVNWLGYYDYK